MNNLPEWLKPVVAYAGTAALSWVASRYHLSGDQVSAVMADVATIAAGLAGVWLHNQAYNSPPPPK